MKLCPVAKFPHLRKETRKLFGKEIVELMKSLYGDKDVHNRFDSNRTSGTLRSHELDQNPTLDQGFGDSHSK